MTRCGWAGNEQIYIDYHDKEWGVPVHDDRKHFEFLVLESAQAGLSWITILKKRENYRKAFDNFDPERIVRYGKEKVEELLNNKGIVRNRRKIEAAINNAKVFIEIQKEFGSFDKYIWDFVGGKPIKNNWTTLEEVPAKTSRAEEISKDLKKRGFKFIGPTICYSYMQAIGLVNDHIVECFRYEDINKAEGKKTKDCG